MDPAQRIFAQAKAGTVYNPGVTDTLASILVAQSRHETGDYTSKFFRVNNNAFGYARYAGSPYQVGAGDIADNKQPIASYNSIEDSTKEVIDWIYRRFRRGQFPDPASIKTVEQYAEALKEANYYGDSLSNYLAGLRRFFTPITAASGAGVLLLVGALLVANQRGWIRLPFKF